jgi:hypothetical protein
VPVGAGRGHRPPNPAAQGPSWTPRTTPNPTQLITGPRRRTGGNNSPPGPLIAQLVAFLASSPRELGTGERRNVFWDLKPGANRA